MKSMKRFLAFTLAAVMTAAMSLSAFAEPEGSSPAGKIKVTNAIEGEEYTLYKVFDATVMSGRTDGGNGIAYTSKWPVPANDFFEVTSKGNIVIKDAAKDDEGKLTPRAAAWLKENLSKFETKAAWKKTASGDTVEWTGLDNGYYYINTTTGSFVTVDSITPNVDVQEKNTLPTADKKQATKSDADFTDETLEVNIGDTVYYQITITNGKGSDKDIVVTDTLTEGLTLNQDEITVIDEQENDLRLDTDYSIENMTATGFKLTLKADYVKTLGEEDKVIVEYHALLNEQAIINSNQNKNSIELAYSHHTSSDAVKVETHDFLVKKTDEDGQFLDGAGFKLYDARTGGNQIKVKLDNTGYYVDQSRTADASVEILVDKENGVNVRGLKPGTYYLEETTTPAGYNTLTAREAVVISEGATAAVEISIKNQKGVELPTTGGTGTTIFYIIGSILVIGAGIVLVAKRRMNMR